MDEAPCCRNFCRKQSVFAGPVVVPAGVIGRRIKADALQRHAGLHGKPRFGANLFEPGGPSLYLDACFGNQNGLAIPCIGLGQNLAGRLV